MDNDSSALLSYVMEMTTHREVPHFVWTLNACNEKFEDNGMQMDFFIEETRRPAITLVQHPSAGYAARTRENAQGAQLTVAFACDFTTAGERLTKRVAGTRYLAVKFGCPVEEAAQTLSMFMDKLGATTLNVAGNGMATLHRNALTQEEANRWVYAVLREVTRRTPIEHIRSGGQTGIDTAGLVAGIALGIPVTGLYPAGFRRRLASGNDVDSDAGTLEAMLKAQAQDLAAGNR